MHEERGLEPVTNVCERLKVPTHLKNLALIVCKEHLKCHQIKNLKPGTVWRLLQRLDVLRKPEKVIAFVQACECDAKGRLGLEDRPTHKHSIFWMPWRLFGIFEHRIYQNMFKVQKLAKCSFSIELKHWQN
jgi:tRNA nucleotidyltransferase/poly(A) polymerase